MSVGEKPAVYVLSSDVFVARYRCVVEGDYVKLGEWRLRTVGEGCG